jgi:catechol 2,3-dioxygenase-like lactoylglutathione lyase family enzyme
MLHHISLPVADLKRSSELYDAILSTLGYRRVCTGKDFAGYGIEDDEDVFAIKEIKHAAAAGPGFHLAFSAPSRAAVDEFHKSALANGATDNGKPGLRAHYEPNYYAAFIMDPDGHRIEAVVK